MVRSEVTLCLTAQLVRHTFGNTPGNGSKWVHRYFGTHIPRSASLPAYVYNPSYNSETVRGHYNAKFRRVTPSKPIMYENPTKPLDYSLELPTTPSTITL